ncbi:MAG: AzlD family protein [Beijerinckiaceae bacterium]
MTLRPEFLPLLLAMAVAAFACRAAGFFLMRYVTVTPRIEAALKATPLAVMVGIVAPAALKGGPAEWAGLAMIFLVMRLQGNDLVAAFAGVATVAAVRWLQLAG